MEDKNKYEPISDRWKDNDKIYVLEVNNAKNTKSKSDK